MVGNIPGTQVHWGFLVGVLLSVALYVLMTRTTFGFAARVTGGNYRAALAQGLPVGRLIVACAMIAGGCAGLAGYFEVAAIQGRANASLAAGYGFTGILVSFLARHNPVVIVPVAILFGGLVASGGLIQRRMGLPDATVLVLQGLIFIVLLVSETLYGRLRDLSAGRRQGPHMSARARHRSDRHAGRRDPGFDAVHVRRARRVPHREIGPRQSRARGNAGPRRDGRLRDFLPYRLALGGRVRGRRRRVRSRRHAWLDLQSASGQRRCGRHRDDAVWHRRRLLLRQALHPADRAAPRLDPVRRLQRRRQSAQRARHQSAVLRRHRRRSPDGVGVRQHPLGPDRAHGRRQRRGGEGDGHLGRLGALSFDHGRRVSRRGRRRVPVAVLSRDPGTRACPRDRA